VITLLSLQCGLWVLIPIFALVIVLKWLGRKK
jgi:hypothetical protein